MYHCQGKYKIDKGYHDILSKTNKIILSIKVMSEIIEEAMKPKEKSIISQFPQIQAQATNSEESK